MNSHSDSAGQSPKLHTGCELVRNDKNCAVHHLFGSKSSLSSPTLPLSGFFNQRGQDTQNYEDSFENSQSSPTASPQISSGENEQSDIKPVVKIEPVNDISEEADMDFQTDLTKMEDQMEYDEHKVGTMVDEHSVSQQDLRENYQSDIKPVIKREPVDDICEEENSEEADMDFKNDLIKMEDQVDYDEHKVETMVDEHSVSQQDLGAEYAVDSEDLYKQQSTRSPPQFHEMGNTSIIDVPAESVNSAMQPQHISLHSESTFSSNLKLQKPTRLSKSNRVHNCPYCTYSSVNKAILTHHLRSHTGEKPFKCAYCAQKFSLKGNLQTHIRIHTGDKPYQCSECDFKSSQLSSLSMHQRIHSGEKPYQCLECDYKANQISSMIKHRRKHSGEKPYQCPECDFKSSQVSNLRMHRRIHSGEKPFQCHECDYKTSRISNLTRHQRTH